MEKIFKFMALKSDPNAFLMFSFLCPDLICKLFKDKSRFCSCLRRNGTLYFDVFTCRLSAHDIIKAYSYRLKIEINFKGGLNQRLKYKFEINAVDSGPQLNIGDLRVFIRKKVKNEPQNIEY